MSFHFKKIPLIFVIFSFASCVSFSPVSPNQLEKLNLLGRWVSDNSWIEIYCSGAMDYEIESLQYSWLGFSDGKCQGCNVAEITNNKIIAGPLWPYKTFEVTKWPYLQDKNWRMTLESRRWLKEKEYSCSKK